MEELLQVFLQESSEQIDALERDLLEAEETRRPLDVAAAFRAFHTLKGNCGLLELSSLGSLAHAAEELLAALRDGTREQDDEVISLLLETTDAVRSMLAALDQRKGDALETSADLAARLRMARRGQAQAKSTRPGDQEITAAEPDESESGRLPPPGPMDSTETASPSARSFSGGREPARGLDRKTKRPESHAPASESSTFGPPRTAPATARVEDTTSRVPIALLDELVDLTGELTLLRNRFEGRLAGDHESEQDVQALSRLISALQENVLRTRVQPIALAFAGVKRAVREACRATGKLVHVEISGEGTGIDRTIAIAVQEPLLHIVRNAIDHGIEPPRERVASGKPEVGTVTITASQSDHHVQIRISDDGAGIDTQRLLATAVREGRLTASQRDGLSQEEALQLVFLPGLSTKEEVNLISGRGIGMDVVRARIETVGGSVRIESHPGQGTDVTVRLPLTLSILSTFGVVCGGHSFRLPIADVREVLRAEEARLRERLVPFGDGWLLEHDERRIPVGDLRSLLREDRCLEPHWAFEERLLVVLETVRSSYALFVDKVTDVREVVIKPLDPILAAGAFVGGATILSDGRPAFLLDADRLQRALGYGSIQRNADQRTLQTKEGGEDIAALLVKDVRGEQYLVAFSDIERVSPLQPTSIRGTSREPLFVYEGRMLPLVDCPELERVQHLGSANRARAKYALVLRDGGPAIAEAEILDTVHAANTRTSSTVHRLGRAVVLVEESPLVLLDADGVRRGLSSRPPSGDAPRRQARCT